MIRLVIVLSVIIFSQLAQTQVNSAIQETRSWEPPEYINTTSHKELFETPKGLEEEVQFWIKIYTQYTTQQGVFHLAGDISHILGEIDLTAIYSNPAWGPIRKEKQAEFFIKQERKKLALKLKIKDPKKIRLQLGLKDRMKTAIFESGKYLPAMEKMFAEKNLPIQLSRIVFVESSFNVNAQSKVGASGLWQIMPNIGKKFKYLKTGSDQRNHPEYATRCAIEILRQNYQILKSWPLAVTSYNFGVGSMLKVRRKMKSNDADEIFSSAHLKKHIGFASRNFYATFLAALQVEAHANIYFGEPLMIGRSLEYKNIYLPQKISYSNLLEQNHLSKDQFKLYNPHIFSKFLGTKKELPAGTLVSIPIKSKSEVKPKDNLAEKGLESPEN